MLGDVTIGGILPTHHEYRVPSNRLILFDDRIVHVEAVSAGFASARTA